MFPKRYLAFIASVLTIIVFCAGYTGIVSGRDDWNFEFKTISGDKALLRDIKISGQLIDYNGVVDFSMTDTGASGHFTYFRNTDEYARNSGNYTGWGGLKNFYYTSTHSYSMYLRENSGNVTILRYGRGSRSRSDLISIASEVRTSKLNYDNGNYMALLNGRFFFIVPTNETSTGTSGIYEVLKFDNIAYEREYDDQKSYKKLASLPVGPESQIRGLYAVGSKLCLLVGDEENYTLKSFDIDTGAFTGECSFKSRWDVWDSYVNGDTLVLLLNDAKVFAFSVSDGIKQLGYLDAFDMNTINGEHVQVARRYIGFLNNRFYILQELLNWPEPEYTYPNAQHEPERILSLLVYDDGVQGYYGHIESDIKDDNIRSRQFNERLLNLDGRKPAPYRQYVSFKVEQSTPEENGKQ